MDTGGRSRAVSKLETIEDLRVRGRTS